MNEMVERVAMAIASDIEEGFPRFTHQRWDELSEIARQSMRQRAFIAIQAMRDPSDQMLIVAHRHFERAPELSRWREMIDEALK